ncbi:MAG: alpha/beta fold hydrolase [Chloroflexi bacterium]|nr:alpha/beta fold hydrolase [Chloroflexota bacterium]
MLLTKKVLKTGLFVGGALGVLAIYNRMTEAMTGELDTVLTGEQRRYPWKYGDMLYSVRGARDAKPLLLIHGFGPGSSSYEWRKNVNALAEQFRVYTPDLMGFGVSDHPKIDYTPETFTDLIHDFIREVIGEPTIVVAHGLTCAYVIASAYRRPQLFERLVLVAPPASLLQEKYPGPLDVAWKFVLRAPIVGQSIYNLLTSRQAIRGYYDRQGYHNPGLISDEMVEYLYTSAHQPNSRFALASLLSNNLNLDVHEPLARLQMPIVAIWGREGMLSPSEASSAFKQVNPRIDVRVLDKSSLQVQEEQVAAFNNLISDFASTTVR